MKRIFTIVTVVAVMMIAAGIYYFNFTRPASGRVAAPKVFAAAQSYAQDLRAHGQTVPATVSLDDLIAKGLLQPDDVSGFSGKEVTVSLTVSESHPQDVLMRVRLQDGSQMVGLADGSVHLVLR